MRKASMVLAICMLSLGANAQKRSTTIISVAPVQVTNNSPTGVGVHLEKIVSDRVSIYLPMAYSFGKNDVCDPSARSSMFYAYPGVKYYPKGSDKKVAFATGLSVGLGIGHVSSTEPSLSADKAPGREKSTVRQAGAVFNNSINVRISPHIVAGAEAGVGMLLYYYYRTTNIAPDILLQGNLKVGYSF